MNCSCGGCAVIAHVERFAAPGAVFLSDRQAGNGSKGNPGGRLPLLIVMKHDPFDAAIDEILESADGDVRRALRAVLEENVQLEFELRNLYAESEHGERADKKSLH
jgi:hypothetical protein